MAGKPDRRRGKTAMTRPGRPPSLQVGALCWRAAKSGLRVLLITSRDTGRWVIPKGWPMHNRTEAGAAEREAFEEAGVKGLIEDRCFGVFFYQKRLDNGRTVPCVVRVYPLEVRTLLKSYPENGQRRVKWFPADKAARKVVEPDLTHLIRVFAARHAAAETEADASAEPDVQATP
jgi:8-oxo-dGTP pyrophosphatase MutT (NUDIX family)